MPQFLKYRRELKYGETVKVYRNLHTGLISVMDKAGHVVAHVSQIILTGAKFLVRESGRQKVLREKRKNVHAFVIGEVVCSFRDMVVHFPGERVTYNPYKYDSFVMHATENPIREAQAASINRNGNIQVIQNES